MASLAIVTMPQAMPGFELVSNSSRLQTASCACDLAAVDRQQAQAHGFVPSGVREPNRAAPALPPCETGTHALIGQRRGLPRRAARSTRVHVEAVSSKVPAIGNSTPLMSLMGAPRVVHEVIHGRVCIGAIIAADSVVLRPAIS